MRNRLVLFCFLCLVLTPMNAQKKDSIIYIMPNSVELKIHEEIKKFDFSEIGLYFFLSTIDKNTYRINYADFPKATGSKDPWADNSNRFLIVNDKKFPLIFDYDSDFSTQRNSMTGNNQKVYIIFDGYSITFNRDGVIISENHGIFENTNYQYSTQ